MSEEFNIYEFGKMFDAAMSSDNPSVKKALRNFMMICAMVHAEDDATSKDAGPFQQVFHRLDELERRINNIDYSKTSDYGQYKKSYDSTWATGSPYTTGTGASSIPYSGTMTQYNGVNISSDTVTWNRSVKEIEDELGRQLLTLMNKGQV